MTHYEILFNDAVITIFDNIKDNVTEIKAKLAYHDVRNELMPHEEFDPLFNACVSLQKVLNEILEPVIDSDIGSDLSLWAAHLINRVDEMLTETANAYDTSDYPD